MTRGAGKRICLVIDRIAGRSGGAERVLVELANELAARGHAVEILSHESREGPPFYPLVPGVSHRNIRPGGRMRSLPRRTLDKGRRGFHRLRLHRYPLDRLSWLSEHGGFWRRLEAHLAAARPDVALAFLPPAITALALARAPEGMRRIGSLHNVPAMDFDSPLRWDPNPYDRKLRRAALGRLDALTVLLPEFRDWFDADLRPRVHVVPNVVTPVDPVLRAGPREKVVLAVGRLAEVKRHDLLLRAWAGLAEEFPDWQLKIFGKGPMEARLRDLAGELGLAEEVEIGVHTDDIASEYRRAAILAHPAEYEGFGLAVSEALSHGVPAVGFDDCPGLNSLVEDGVNGLLVAGDTGDRVAAFRDALRGLMSRPELRQRLAAAAPGSMARFAPKTVYDLWEKVLLPPGSGEHQLHR